MKKTSITREHVDQMQKLRNEGYSNAKIAETLDIDPKTVAFHLGKSLRKNSRRVTKEEEKRMRELREQGLSNNQIAIEMKMPWKTVTNHIGKQPRGNRSKYGSIVSHADGESFVTSVEPFRPLSARVEEAPEQEPEWAKEIKAKQAAEAKDVPSMAIHFPEAKKTEKKTDISFGLQTVSNVSVYQGQDLRYRVNSSGYISIWAKHDREENGLLLSFDQFNKMLEEILQLIDKIPA